MIIKSDETERGNVAERCSLGSRGGRELDCDIPARAAAQTHAAAVPDIFRFYNYTQYSYLFTYSTSYNRFIHFFFVNPYLNDVLATVNAM